MPIYRVRDPKTGRTVRLRGTSPPTEAEASQVFETLELETMLPRETKLGRDEQKLPSKPAETSTARPSVKPREKRAKRFPPTEIHHWPERGIVSAFIDEHMRHFNGGVLRDAAHALNEFLARDGKVLLAMAGAFSTGELGAILAPLIRAGKVHAISCSGANLEESGFDLVGHRDYEQIRDYHDLTAEDDEQLAERKMNRVTDVAIPERAMTPIEDALKKRWAEAMRTGDRKFPHEFLYDVLQSGELKPYQGDPDECWLLAAAEKNLPIFVPGVEDSTTGNVFAAECVKGELDASVLKGGIEAMMELVHWYQETSAKHDCAFWQLGGGIAGDFAICVVPLLEQDLGIKDTKKWQLFIQHSSGHESYGSYSDALPNEKASWGKCQSDCPMFDIKSDFTLSFPLLGAALMGW